VKIRDNRGDDLEEENQLYGKIIEGENIILIMTICHKGKLVIISNIAFPLSCVEVF
jgi:hypothetical protein